MHEMASDSFIMYREIGYEFQIQKQINTLGEKINIGLLVWAVVLKTVTHTLGLTNVIH